MAWRALQWRVALIATGILVLIMWRVMAGGRQSVILIEFGMYPQTFEGLEVVIDDEVVGTLKRMGARTQTGFKVKDGDHLIALRHPEYRSEPIQVTAGFGANKVMLLAGIEQTSRHGKDETYLVLNR